MALIGNEEEEANCKDWKQYFHFEHEASSGLLDELTEKLSESQAEVLGGGERLQSIKSCVSKPQQG